MTDPLSPTTSSAYDCTVAVRAQEKAHIRLKNFKTKYPFVHPNKGLRGAAVNLTLVWHVMPRVGECYATSW